MNKQFHHQLSGIMVVLLLTLVSCGDDNANKSTKVSPPAQVAYTPKSPAFQSDSAYYFIEKQVSFGPRVTNSKAHQACGDWLVNELKKYTEQVTEQKTVVTHFDGQKLNVRNIIAAINPKATKRILLCAHWDTRPFADEDVQRKDEPILGANDGGSGVGVLLEIARVLQANPIAIGVDIVLFDAEDLGKSEHENSYCLGSQYWSANLHQPGYKADFGILLDMVGGANARFAWEEQSIYYAQPILKKVWEKAHLMGYGANFVYFQKGGIIDDHVYVNRNAKIPTIDIIHYDANSRSGFPEHWHTHRDNMSAIDRNTLKAVGQTLLEVIYTY